MNKYRIKEIKAEIKEKFGFNIPTPIIRYIGKIYADQREKEMYTEKKRRQERLMDYQLGYDE